MMNQSAHVAPRQYENPGALLDAYVQHAGSELRLPIDVEGIAGFLGISVKDYADFDNPEIIGKISAIEDVVKIEINSLQNSYAPRRRFTIAHELGHYCLHFHNGTQKFVDTKSSMSRSESYWDAHESQANSFAARLLMPSNLVVGAAEQVIAVYAKQTGAATIPRDEFVGRMAEAFNVSNVAMEYRLVGMNILSAK